MNINMNDCWYSPAYVIYMTNELIEIYGQKIIDKDPMLKRVSEMKAVAIMLLAQYKVFGKHYFMQSSKEEFPDVWTLYQEEVPGKNVDTKYQTVEVVTYETHSNMPVADFILKTKLINPKKAYDEDTVILCYIRKSGTFIDFNILYKKLGEHKFKPSRVFVLGNKLFNEKLFIVSQVWPAIHHEVIDYITRTKTYPLPHKMFFKKGVPKKINYKTGSTTLKTNPYEIFNLDESYLRNKYKKSNKTSS